MFFLSPNMSQILEIEPQKRGRVVQTIPLQILHKNTGIALQNPGESVLELYMFIFSISYFLIKLIVI